MLRVRIIDRTKSVVTTYILPAIAVLLIQFVVLYVWIGAGFACDIGLNVKCQIAMIILPLLGYGAPLAGTYIVFLISKNWQKSLLFLLTVTALDVLLYWYWAA